MSGTEIAIMVALAIVGLVFGILFLAAFAAGWLVKGAFA